MKKKQIITIGGCGVVGLLLLTGVFLVFRSVGTHRRLEAAFKRLQKNLAAFYQAEAFPSLENVKRERENREQVDAWYTSLMTELASGNVSSTERSPSRFVGILERARLRLLEQAVEKRVRLPQGAEPFGFGFERYVGTGQLPEPDDVPRLTEQLILTTRLARMLFESDITSLALVERDAVEGQAGMQDVQAEVSRAAESARSRGRRSTARRAAPEPEQQAARRPGQISEGADFSTYRFVLQFTARESALREVLHNLVSVPTFIVVRSLQISKEVPDLLVVRTDAGEEAVAPAAGGPATGRRTEGQPAPNLSFLFGGEETDARPDTAPPAPPEKRVLGPSHPVSGIEMEIPMKVRLELDVYKFRGLDEAGN